jgi:hypothetical protein
VPSTERELRDRLEQTQAELARERGLRTDPALLAEMVRLRAELEKAQAKEAKADEDELLDEVKRLRTQLEAQERSAARVVLHSSESEPAPRLERRRPQGGFTVGVVSLVVATSLFAMVRGCSGQAPAQRSSTMRSLESPPDEWLPAGQTAVADAPGQNFVGRLVTPFGSGPVHVARVESACSPPRSCASPAMACSS